MSITPFVFDPVTGWEDSSVFPTTRDNEELVRADLQRLHTQTRNYINNTLAPQIESALADQKTELEGEIAAISQGAVPDNTITAAKLTANSVTTPKIADGAVTTPKIADEAVTKAKLSESLAAEIDGKLDAPVGTIIQSVRTDLGDKWALCNGDFNDLTDPTEKAALDAVLKKNDIPKPNPDGKRWSSVTRYGGYEMYNGEFYAPRCYDGTSNWVVIYDANGRVATFSGGTEKKCKLSDLPVTSGTLLGVENDGTKYVFFFSTADNNNKTIKVFSSADFVTFTTPQVITTNYEVYKISYNDGAVVYDGHNYYVAGTSANIQNNDYTEQVAYCFCEVNGAFIQVGSAQWLGLARGWGELCVCRTGSESIVFIFRASSHPYGTALWFDSTGTVHTIYQNDDSYYYVPSCISVFNDTYLIAWGYGGAYNQLQGYFINRADKSIAGLFNFDSYNGDFATISADKTRFLYYWHDSSSNGYRLYCKSISTAAITGWTEVQVGLLAETPFYSSGSWSSLVQRSADSVVLGPYLDHLVRAKLLPLLPSDECYSYIKVKE